MSLQADPAVAVAVGHRPKTSTFHLQGYALWVVWRSEVPEEGGKPTKVSYQPLRPDRKAASNRPKEWATYAEAAAAWRANRDRFEGIGLMFGVSDDGAYRLGGLDLDLCYGDEGVLEPWAAELLAPFESYSEVSPSGHGLKKFFLWPTEMASEVKKWRKVVRLGPPDPERGDKSPGIEVYFTGRWFALTGDLSGDELFIHLAGPEQLREMHGILDRHIAERAAAARARGPVAQVEPPPRQRDAGDERKRLESAVLSFANHDLHWEEWNRYGMLIYVAFGASEGRQWFHWFSKQSTLYNEAYTDAKWAKLCSAPPTGITIASVFWTALHHHGWRDPTKSNGREEPPPSDLGPDNDPAEQAAAAAKPKPAGTPFRHVNADGTYWQELKARHDVRVEHFRHYQPKNDYIFMPSIEHWTAGTVARFLGPMGLFHADGSPVMVVVDGVEKQVTMTCAGWLIHFRPVQQVTWAPGEPKIIKHRLTNVAGWVPHKGAQVFNQYIAPTIEPGDPTKAGPWRELVQAIYPDHAAHIEHFLAHRRQRPWEKINHSLLLSGPPGIGKDMMLKPMRHAVGPANFRTISPSNVFDDFNPWRKAVILQISETRDTGDYDRFSFYERTKDLMAEPPEMLEVNDKYLRSHYVPNVLTVIMTTNYKAFGVFLPSDDRRHYVAASDKETNWAPPDYWERLDKWYEREGFRHVVAYLDALNLSAFKPKAPPPKTAAFWDIVAGNTPTQNAELEDALDEIARPTVLTLKMLARANNDQPFLDWLFGQTTKRAVSDALEKAGYSPVRKPGEQTVWRMDGTRQTIYGIRTFTPTHLLTAAEQLAKLGIDGAMKAARAKARAAKEAADAAEKKAGRFV